MIPGSQGAIDLAMATARKALQDYERDLADYERETGMAQTWLMMMLEEQQLLQP